MKQPSLSFHERLALPRPILTDGSMATELHSRGLTEQPSSVYNLKNPVVVEQVHRDFLNAGAELIEANTEIGNRFALEKYKLADKVYEINRKGVWIARCAALHRGYVAGVVGPIGKFMAPLGKITPDEVRQAFVEQIIALSDGGCDVLMLKSFIDVEELIIAIEAAQFVNSDLPVIALKTFPEDGAVLATSFPRDVATRLRDKQVAVIGANGTVGPQRMLGILESFRIDGVPICAQPDIGIPTLIDGVPFFNAEPEYVAQSVRRLVEAGAVLIGADGGATVEHVKAIKKALDGALIASSVREPKHTLKKPIPTPETDERSSFAKALAAGDFVATVELDVPRGLDMSSVVQGAAYLKENGLTAVNISDGARARVRMSSIAISAMVQQQTGMECLTHLACRDRNLIGLQSELLGAYAHNVKNILAVTGDPSQIGDFPYSSSVYDVDAIGLIRALARMNAGEDLMSNPIGMPTSFCITCGCNPVADDIEREVDRLAQKAEQGAVATFSQPIFDGDTLDRFLDKIAHIDIKFILGVIPLRSLRHANFLHYEIPGMTVPEWVRERIAAAGDNVEAASAEGVRLAVEFLEVARPRISGVYLMPPFKKYSMAVDILNAANVQSNTSIHS